MGMTRRHDVLRKVGYSTNEIREYAKLAAIARNQRKATKERMNLEPLQYRMELTYRGVRNATWNRSNKKKEREWLKQWRALTQLQLQAPKAKDQGFYDSGNSDSGHNREIKPLKRSLSPSGKQLPGPPSPPNLNLPAPPSPPRPSVALNSSQGTELTHMMSSLNLSSTSFQNSKSSLNASLVRTAQVSPRSEAKKKPILKTNETKKQKKIPNSIKKRQRMEDQQSVNLWLRLVGENR